MYHAIIVRSIFVCIVLPFIDSLYVTASASSLLHTYITARRIEGAAANRPEETFTLLSRILILTSISPLLSAATIASYKIFLFNLLRLTILHRT